MTLETLKAPETAPTDNLDHLINQMALICRATKKEYDLSEEQCRALHDRFYKIYDAYPEVSERVFEAAKAKDPFWIDSSDSILKRLKDAGILVDGLGL